MRKPPKKRYIILLVIILYIVLKFYVSFTRDMDDQSVPENFKDTVINVIDELYDY